MSELELEYDMAYNTGLSSEVLLFIGFIIGCAGAGSVVAAVYYYSFCYKKQLYTTPPNELVV